MTFAAQRPVRCALHVHTSYGRTGLALPRILDHARESGVECLVITDHGEAAAARDGWQGWHDGILVIVGSELRTRDRFDILGLGTHLRVATGNLQREEALRLMQRVGMTRFAAHPEGVRHALTGGMRRAWDRLDTLSLDGLEIWNYMVDWMRQFRPWRLGAMCRTPGNFITGPQPDILAAWDRIAATRPIGGIGSLDSHALVPGRLVRALFPDTAEGILPYAQNFRALAHYALVPAANWGSSATHDILAVIGALRCGSGWFCREELAPGRDFAFAARSGESTWSSGASGVPCSGTELSVVLPCEASIRVIGPAGVCAEKTGSFWSGPVPGRGAYRVECLLDGMPWLFSNHIRVGL